MSSEELYKNYIKRKNQLMEEKIVCKIVMEEAACLFHENSHIYFLWNVNGMFEDKF